MIKRLYIHILLLSVLCLAGCGKNTAKPSGVISQQSSVADVLQQGMAEADGKAAVDISDAENETYPTETPVPPTPAVSISDIAAANEAEGIDIDLTRLSSTMVYAEVFSMMTNSKEYVGKKIRMKGIFSYYHNKPTDTYYFACLIKDATACCAQGVEFVLKDNYSFPDDYPRPGDEIIVTGVFEPYLEDNYTFYHIADAVYSE